LWARNINKVKQFHHFEDEFISYTSFINDDFGYFFINTGEKIKE
jgi:hypothetical protein